MFCIRYIADKCIQQSVAVVLFRCFFFIERERERIALFSIAATRQMFNFQLVSKKHFSRSAEGVSQKAIIKTNKQACAKGSKAKQGSAKQSKRKFVILTISMQKTRLVTYTHSLTNQSSEAPNDCFL